MDVVDAHHYVILNEHPRGTRESRIMVNGVNQRASEPSMPLVSSISEPTQLLSMQKGHPADLSELDDGPEEWNRHC
jgi:hypothetical protein